MPHRWIKEPDLSKLRALYGEEHRHYHTWAHIDDLAKLYRQEVARVRNPRAFQLALLFHDAIYNPRRSDNEDKSAELLETWMRGHERPEDLKQASAVIRATAKHAVPPDLPERERVDCALFLDLDLAILAAEEEAFDTYDAAIAKEYAHVTDADYRKGRAAILRDFLERPRLFLTERLETGLRSAANRNLTRALARLET